MNQKSLPWRHLSLALTMTCIGIVLSLKGQPLLAWFFGQVLLAGAFLQWFCILHEAGHNTFFERRRANVLVGHLASFFSVLPFHSWQMIHHQHHLWTGWRDIDPTMSQTVPRELKAFEKRVMNFCWRYWVPLFSVLYRSNNYWNLPRLRTLFKSEALQETLNRNIWSLALVYVVCLIVLGPSFFIREFGFF
jgi:omega-6 fatty acid desaturase (delta-12 desaturase)